MKKKLLILFLFLSIFMIVGCKKKEEEQPKVVEEVRDLKEDEIEKLSQNVSHLYYFDINPAKSFKTTELTNQEVLLWASGLSSADGVLFDVFAKEAMDYLDFSLEPENILCMTHSNKLGSSDYKYIYDVNTKKYVKNKAHINHSETGYYAYVANRDIRSFYRNGDYVITFVKLFSDTDLTEPIPPDRDMLVKRNWYRTYADAKSKKNPVVKNMSYYDARKQLDNIEVRNLIKYTYTFRLKNDKFILKSYVIEV